MTNPLTHDQAWRIAAITITAILLYAGFRLLPTGTNLNHMDFRVEGGSSIEFCDPSNPQFIPVVAVRSPVTMTLQTQGVARAGATVKVQIRLATSGGKPLGPGDLVVAHTRKLHLLIVDPTLADYQHVHPEPGEKSGDWLVSFRPQAGGLYRFFADFTPAATRRGLYASADLEVEGATKSPSLSRQPGLQLERGDVRFSLTAGTPSIQAGVTADLTFTLESKSGADLKLEPVMDAYAHLVAFDEKRGGFAHLHPIDPDLAHRPDPRRPSLGFKVTIPQPGRYVIWAQVGLSGEEVFLPFWFEVVR
jgi:hypothetical protein